MVRECIADIVNVCGRDGTHVVTGPVWEYFASPERLFVSPLRVTPFEQVHEVPLRQRLVSLDLDRLIRRGLGKGLVAELRCAGWRLGRAQRPHRRLDRLRLVGEVAVGVAAEAHGAAVQ